MREAVGAAPCFVIELGGQTEIAELQAQRGQVDQHVLRRHIAMHQALRVHRAERLGELDGQLQAFGQAEAMAFDGLGEVAAAEVFQHQHQAAPGTLQAARLDHIGRINGLQQRVLVAPARQLGGGGQVGVEQLEHHRLSGSVMRGGDHGVADGVDDGSEREPGELHGAVSG